MEESDVTEVKQRLFDAFREDHARLGGALHALGERLRAGDERGARTLAARLDAETGAHVAFEEANFYPALAPFLDAAEIDAMYAEHADGRALLADVGALADGALAASSCREALLRRVQALETHVSDCGELFGAMGGLDVDAQLRLLEDLDAWRTESPRWSELPASLGRASGDSPPGDSPR